MTPGTLVILDNPSPEYERWRGQCGIELDASNLCIDIRLMTPIDRAEVLRVRPLAVRKAVGKVA